MDKVDKAAEVIDGPVAKNRNIRKKEHEKLEKYQGLRAVAENEDGFVYIERERKREH